MSTKYLKIVREYIVPYDVVYEKVIHGSNNAGSALEEELFEEAETWIDEGWMPVTESKQVVSYR